MSSIVSNCKEIQSILDGAKKQDISINEVSEGWSESIRSFAMSNSLSNTLRDYFIRNHPTPKYHEYEGTPHNRPYRGFKCMDCRETVIFPER